MKFLKKQLFIFVTVLTLLASYSLPYVNSASAEETNTYNLTIIHTNDTHAALDNMPRTVTALKEVRAANPNSLLLHAGDAFTGTLYFNKFHGEADLALMNLMGFDAMTFGNHEFDLGSSNEGHQALADFIKGAQFPFVSANVDFSKDAKFDGIFNTTIPSDFDNGQIYNGIIKEVNGEKVGIFGLTTEETKDISSPGSIAFENYIDEAKKAVQALEAQGVNKIIALTHIGFDDNAAIDNDQILAKNVEGIDVIVGGHSHTTLTEPFVVNDATPTVIVQTGNSNSNLGVLNVTFDENGVVASQNGHLIKIDNKIAADSEAVNVLAPYKAEVDELAQKEIGVSTSKALENPRTDGDNTKSSVRRNETILGNLITDGMLKKAKSFTGKNVVMALQNGGGIRSAIDAGPITVGEVITVLPFNNTLATMDVTGAELKAAFEISLGQYPGENGGFLHVAGGKVEFDSSKPKGERVVSVSYLNENGKYVEIQDGITYTVATNAFTAKGGDGFDVFAKAYAEGRVTDLGLSDWENFRDHLVSIKSEGIPTKVEGRIVDVAAKPAPTPTPAPTPAPEKVVLEPATTVDASKQSISAKVEAKDITNLQKDAVLTVTPKDAEGKVELKVTLGADALNQLIQNNNVLQVNKGDVQTELSASLLKLIAQQANGQNVTISMTKKTVDGAIGPVYDFTIQAGTTTFHDFGGQKVNLTFKVAARDAAGTDQSKVKVFYYNETTKKWEVLADSKYDAATGTVTATTTHFSTYGVFADNDAAKGTPNNISGHLLPNTATDAYNYLFLGLLIVAAGLTLFMKRRRIQF
jgi:2',3'-cyclic-nucleotide 2'-phosphodiesterase / 3'-nucleotidase / 5'-nucleotidase